MAGLKGVGIDHIRAPGSGASGFKGVSVIGYPERLSECLWNLSFFIGGGYLYRLGSHSI